MSYEVSLIPTRAVRLTWPDVKNHIERAVAVARGRDTWEQVYGRLITGDSQLWIAYRTDGKKEPSVICGAVVTSIKDYETKKVLRIQYCGGRDIDKWVNKILELMEKFAVDQRLDALELIGRLGWKRMLEKEGWENVSLFMEKPLPKAA